MLEKYLHAVQEQLSYVGYSEIEINRLWDEINIAESELIIAGINYPSYESIECTTPDWW